MRTQYKVDLYLAGHVHNYERLWPVGPGMLLALFGLLNAFGRCARC